MDKILVIRNILTRLKKLPGNLKVKVENKIKEGKLKSIVKKDIG